MSRTYIILTPEAEKLARRIIKAKAKGHIEVSDAKIAEFMGVSASKISLLRSSGKKVKVKKTKTQKPVAVVAAIKAPVLTLLKSKPESPFKGRTKPISEKQKATLTKMVLAGKGPKEVMEATGVSQTTFHRHKKRILSA